ncbi:MAG: caspase family protein [Myxococcota bacterium]
MMRSLMVMVALLLSWSGVAAADTVRIGLFVGNNIGLGPDAPLRYAEEEARDMARLFQSMGAMERDRTILLEGPRAFEVRQKILQVEAMVREAGARGDDVMLVFFYSGHASSDGLHLSGGLLPLNEVRRWLESSAAQVRVAFVDACESGSLARSRGGTPVEAVEIVVDDQLTVSGLAVITSTGPVSVARESASFGGGVFSQALISGLRGSADLDNDGQITLNEAYRYSAEETVVGSAALSTTVQRPEYRYEIEGMGNVVLTRIPSRAAGLIFPEELEGVYTVVSVSNGQVVARIEKTPGEPRRLALPIGRYLVRKVRQQDVLLAEVDLAWGGDRWLEDAQMNAVALGDPLARGGWNLRPMRLSLYGNAGTPIVRGNEEVSGTPSTVGLTLNARYLMRPGLGVVGFYGQSIGEDEVDEGIAAITTGNQRVGVGVSGERHLPRLDLSVSGGLVGMRISQQLEYLDFEDGEIDGYETYDAQALVPGAWVGAGVHLPIGPVFGLEAGVRGNLLLVQVDEMNSLLYEGQVFFGLAANFGGRQISRAKRRD